MSDEALKETFEKVKVGSAISAKEFRRVGANYNKLIAMNDALKVQLKLAQDTVSKLAAEKFAAIELRDKAIEQYSACADRFATLSGKYAVLKMQLNKSSKE